MQSGLYSPQMVKQIIRGIVPGLAGVDEQVSKEEATLEPQPRQPREVLQPTPAQRKAHEATHLPVQAGAERALKLVEETELTQR